MNIKHLDHLNLTVESFDEAIDWYGRVFGFELVEQGTIDGVRWGVVRSGEAMLCLYEHAGRRVPEDATMRWHRLHGISHVGFRISDPAAWEDTIAREGIEVSYGGAVHWPHSTAWYVEDPSGYEIEVVHWNGDSVAFDPLRVA